MTESWIEAVWEAPARIRAGATTRLGGTSASPYDSLNLAEHVADDPAAVGQNRRLLRNLCQLPAEPLWLKQTHSNRVIEADTAESISADAAWTRRPDIVCAILTADCVPLLVCNRSGTMVAAIHVGWRGLCAGIIENTLQRIGESQPELLGWLGPHICSTHYEVGDDVRDACLHRFSHAGEAFRENRHGRWLCSLERLVTGVLQEHGVTVTACGHCTFGEPGRFYSYRRQRQTGRTASLIWMDRNVI